MSCYTRAKGRVRKARKARLTNRVGLRVALIVNDVGSINLDERAIQETNLVRQDEKLVELSNGCICCTRQGAMLDEVRKIAATADVDGAKRRFDVLIIESTGCGMHAGNTRARAGVRIASEKARAIRTLTHDTHTNEYTPTHTSPHTPQIE